MSMLSCCVCCRCWPTVRCSEVLGAYLGLLLADNRTKTEDADSGNTVSSAVSIRQHGLTQGWHYWCICISQCQSLGHMKGLPEQWTHPHTESVILAAHQLEASCSCINTNKLLLRVQHISIVCIHFAGSAYKCC